MQSNCLVILSVLSNVVDWHWLFLFGSVASPTLKGQLPNSIINITDSWLGVWRSISSWASWAQILHANLCQPVPFLCFQEFHCHLQNYSSELSHQWFTVYSTHMIAWQARCRTWMLGVASNLCLSYHSDLITILTSSLPLTNTRSLSHCSPISVLSQRAYQF